jgi:hypothetical protein
MPTQPTTSRSYRRAARSPVCGSTRSIENRIYAIGFSSGARMSSRLACDLSDRMAAIGPVGGLRYPEDCAPTRPVPVIAFHGKRDDQPLRTASRFTGRLADGRRRRGRRLGNNNGCAAPPDKIRLDGDEARPGVAGMPRERGRRLLPIRHRQPHLAGTPDRRSLSPAGWAP